MKSKAVVAAGYDERTAALELEFRSGHVYRYEGVPRGVYDWLLRIENKGSFVRRMIQGRYLERAVGRAGSRSGPPPAAEPAPPGDGLGDGLEEALRASLERLGKPGG